MACPINEALGKTIVQVKVPVCISIQLDQADAEDMTQSELCGLVDSVINQYSSEKWVMESSLYPRRWMQSIPVKYAITQHWDELPIDELEITSLDAGLFEKRGDEDDEE